MMKAFCKYCDRKSDNETCNLQCAHNTDNSEDVSLFEDKDQWINVKDKLPENERRVAILYRYKKSTRGLIKFVSEYNPYQKVWRNKLQDITICYWCDLPEAPKGWEN